MLGFHSLLRFNRAGSDVPPLADHPADAAPVADGPADAAPDGAPVADGPTDSVPVADAGDVAAADVAATPNAEAVPDALAAQAEVDEFEGDN